MENRDIKKELADLINSFRREFITNPKYRHLDLNFDTFLIMMTGMSESTFEELNNIAISKA